APHPRETGHQGGPLKWYWVRASVRDLRRHRLPQSSLPQCRAAQRCGEGDMTRRRPEAAIQRAVFQHLRARASPGVFAFHPANGGYRKPVEAAIMKGLGVKPGVPDVIAIHNGRCFAIELKAEGGRATDKQLACIAALREAGAFTCIAEGLDRALACLEGWGLLVGRRQ